MPRGRRLPDAGSTPAASTTRRIKNSAKKWLSFLFARGRPQCDRRTPRAASSCPEQGTVRTRAASRGTLFFEHGKLFALQSSMGRIERYYVYILKCSDNTLYVGYTINLRSRLSWHRSGFASQHTAQRLPVKLVYSEEHMDETSARDREAQIKRWSGQKKQALIRGDLDLLRNLSKSRD